MLDDTPTNDNELHQVICNNFKIDYFQEMDVIIKLRNRLECKINYTLPALLPNKLNIILMFKDYITILVGTLQRIHRQYIRYE